MFDYIGAKDTSSRNQFGGVKQTVYWVIDKQGNNNFKIEKENAISKTHVLVGWKDLKQLKALIKTFDVVTKKGEKYLEL